MKIRVIARTTFNAILATDETGWMPEDDAYDDFHGGSYLAEFAGRSCYASWGKPNKATATNEGYLAHIIEVGHGSVMEHGSVTLYVTDVSRSLTHELVRHRHHSYSQLSQRFVAIDHSRRDGPQAGVDFIVPPLLVGDHLAESILAKLWDDAAMAYDALMDRATTLLSDRGVNGRAAHKRAREAARAVLPNMTPTAIVVTGNHRAWRELMVKRGSLAADAEIRGFAIEAFRLIAALEPSLYQDLAIYTSDDDPEGYIGNVV